eukprot:jgi/Mesen1/9759/ME000007S09818
MVRAWRPLTSLRWSPSSASHFGSCGLHQGTSAADNTACAAGLLAVPPVLPEHFTVGIDESRPVRYLGNGRGPTDGFGGWGGWGDRRDHELCRHISRLKAEVEVKREPETETEQQKRETETEPKAESELELEEKEPEPEEKEQKLEREQPKSEMELET